MNVEFYKNFKPIQASAQNSVNAYNFSPQNAYIQPEWSPGSAGELFSDSDTETAKNTGGIVLAGLAIREVLKHWSNHLFTSFLSKNNNIDPDQLKNIGFNMLKDNKLLENPQKIVTPQADIYAGGHKNLKLIIDKEGSNAYFSHVTNEIRVSKNTLLSLPHEIGHAIEEHQKPILSKLQRFRGNYTFLALLLYGLSRNKSTDPAGRESFFGKIQNTLHKYSLLIPLLAFSPELITEYKASKIGIDYMKKAKVPENILKAAKKHYAVAFCTYLALPAFAVLDNFILRKAAKG